MHIRVNIEFMHFIYEISVLRTYEGELRYRSSNVHVDSAASLLRPLLRTNPLCRPNQTPTASTICTPIV